MSDLMLAKCSVFIATSLDGFISRNDGSIDWLMKANSLASPGEDCGYKSFMSTVDGLVMGRYSFEKILSFDQWPYEDIPVVVMSSQSINIPTHLKTSVSTSSEAPLELVNRLTREGLKHLYIDGGITIQKFITDHLVSELTITLIPVLLGSGRSLFGPLAHDIELNHIETKCFDGGFVQLKYSMNSTGNVAPKRKSKDKMYLVYDEISEWFDTHRSKELIMEKFYLDLLQKHISSGSKILDIGCGTGEPIAQFLIAQGYQLTGVDASEKMISLCQQRFPNATWLLADMRTLKLQEKFQAVIAWHSFFHLPHDDQRSTLKLLASLVEKNGLLIFTSGEEYGEVWSDNGGHDLYHASLSSAEYTAILASCHFEILIHKVRDPDCGEATVWVAKKK